MIAALYVMCEGACGGEFSASSPEDLSQGDSSPGAVLDASVTGSGGSTGSVGSTVGTGGSAGSPNVAGAGGLPAVTDAALPPIDSNAGGAAGVGSTDGGVVNGRDATVSPGAGIFCGGAQCDPTTQVCCAEVGALDPGSTAPLRCVAKGQCSGMSPMNIPCDDHADCVARGQPKLPICCVGTSIGQPMGHFILMECTTTGGCTTNTSARHEYVCSGLNDHESCPAGKVCRAGLLREGYFTCQ